MKERLINQRNFPSNCMPDRYLQVVESSDNVATALREVSSGETVTVGVADAEWTVEVRDDVEFGHKIALEDVPEGSEITKYGKSIGNASQDIAAGEWVHVHNVGSNYGRGDLADNEQTQAVSE
jgi:altronate dehydratase small subunit